MQKSKKEEKNITYDPINYPQLSLKFWFNPSDCAAYVYTRVQV